MVVPAPQAKPLKFKSKLDPVPCQSRRGIECVLGEGVVVTEPLSEVVTVPVFLADGCSAVVTTAGMVVAFGTVVTGTEIG